jgi:hypothetical protein
MDCFPKPLLADREMILFTFSSVILSGYARWQICRAILSIHHNGLEVNAGVQSEPEVVNGVIFVMDELAFSDGVVQ